MQSPNNKNSELICISNSQKEHKIYVLTFAKVTTLAFAKANYCSIKPQTFELPN